MKTRRGLYLWIGILKCLVILKCLFGSSGHVLCSGTWSFQGRTNDEEDFAYDLKNYESFSPKLSVLFTNALVEFF